MLRFIAFPRTGNAKCVLRSRERTLSLFVQKYDQTTALEFIPQNVMRSRVQEWATLVRSRSVPKERLGTGNDDTPIKLV